MGEGNLGNQNHQKTLSGIVGTVTGIVAGAGLAAFCINNPYMPYVVAIGAGAFVAGGAGAFVAGGATAYGGSAGGAEALVGGVIGAGAGAGGALVGGALGDTGAFVGSVLGVVVAVGVGALVSEGNFMQRRYGKAVKNFAYAGILTGGAMVAGNYLGPGAEIDALRYFQIGADKGVVVTVDGEQRPYLDVDGKLVLFDDARQQGSNLENKISRDKWDERLELIKNSVRSEGEVKK